MATHVSDGSARLRCFHSGPDALRARWWLPNVPEDVVSAVGAELGQWFDAVGCRLLDPFEPLTWNAALANYPPPPLLLGEHDLFDADTAGLHLDSACAVLTQLGLPATSRTLVPVEDLAATSELLTARGCIIQGCGATSGALLYTARAWRAACESLELLARTSNCDLAAPGARATLFGDIVAVEAVLAGHEPDTPKDATVGDPMMEELAAALDAALERCATPTVQSGKLWWVSWRHVADQAAEPFDVLAAHSHHRDSLACEALCFSPVQPPGATLLEEHVVLEGWEPHLFFELRSGGWPPEDAWVAVRVGLLPDST